MLNLKNECQTLNKLSPKTKRTSSINKTNVELEKGMSDLNKTNIELEKRMSDLNKTNVELEKRMSVIKTNNKMNFHRKNAPYQEASKFSLHIRVCGEGFRTQPQFSGFSL